MKTIKEIKPKKITGMKSKKLSTILFTILMISLVGCGGGSESKKKLPIQLLSPANGQTVLYSNITLEVAKGNLTEIKAKNLSLTDAKVISATDNGDVVFLYRLFLVEGENDIEISAVDGAGKNVTIKVSLTSKNFGLAPIALNLSEDEGYGSITTDVNVKPFDNAKEFLIDKDNDGVIDDTQASGEFLVTYDAVGRYTPIVTVRTRDNVLYTDARSLVFPITVKSNPVFTVVDSISDAIVDLETDGEFIYALAVNKFYKISIQDETDVQAINFFNMSDPQGFALDENGNVFIADAADNRIVKFLKATNYSIDTSISITGSFGDFGTGNGEFDTPRDVSVTGIGDEQKIFVLDAGNNRVQIFNFVGAYIGQFDGSTTPGGKLDNPLNMIGAPNVIITDSGNSVIRGLSLSIDGNEREDFSVAISNEFGKITYASSGIVVPDLLNQELTFLYKNGAIIKKIKLQDNPLVALPYGESGDVMDVSQEKNGITKVSVELDPPGHSPKDKVELFIQAFIDDDTEKMLELTGGKTKYVEKLTDSRAKAVIAFNNITDYEQSVNNSFSGVTANFKIDDLEANIKFVLDRVNGQWIITSIL